MPKLTTIAITTTGEASVTTLLSGFKAYASISDENLDGMGRITVYAELQEPEEEVLDDRT